ncbi:MAG: restriction endonuclease subunit S [Paenibacillus sp.]|uniref:restriction endonuclease subunit S n=1 Tax=Paenibacillus sp. TaxID=58172 RepID=UPI0025F4CF38|nr:restriction endonuclease subunit S [Paenibacillus sp.]MBR2564282.1 restriction endonuclease subunit S [Paenibacillus sp.]
MKCIEDEIPFEAPDGWEWARLGSIAEADLGKMLDAAKNKGLPRPYLRNINVRWGVFDLTDLLEMRIQDEEVERYSVLKGDLVVCEGGEPGRCAIWEAENGVFFQKALHRVRPHLVSSEYVFLVIYALSLSGLTERYFTGTTIKHLTGQALKALLIPIPPIHEQGRICGAANKALDIVDDIEENKEVLVSTLSLAKSRILDLAIRGLLVPQNPDDEPASVLLDRICKEKEMLIKHGKIKRDKRESIIFRGDDNSYYEKIGDDVSCIDDELPYDIPEGWAWCELQQCCVKEIKRGRSPKYAEKGQVLSFAQKCNQKNGGINIGLALWIDDATIGRYSEDEYMRDGDIIINSTGTGTLGRVGVYHSSDNPSAIPIVPDSHVTVVRASGYVHPSYLYLCLKAMQSSIENMGEGSTNQKELKPLTIQQLRIPLPPYAEQIMICKRVHTMRTTVSMIEAEL